MNSRVKFGYGYLYVPYWAGIRSVDYTRITDDFLLSEVDLIHRLTAEEQAKYSSIAGFILNPDGSMYYAVYCPEALDAPEYQMVVKYLSPTFEDAEVFRTDRPIADFISDGESIFYTSGGEIFRRHPDGTVESYGPHGEAVGMYKSCRIAIFGDWLCTDLRAMTLVPIE